MTNVQISGLGSISGVAGNKQWSASAQGGDGQSMSYTWESSATGTGGWTQVGTGATYTRYIGSGDSQTTFYLRVTATSNGKSGQSGVKQVDIEDIADPLDVSVSGTNAILSSGWYAWTLSASGGTTPYSYLWEYCDGSCTSVGTGTSYSRYVQLGDGDFTVKLTVTDSGSGDLQQQEIIWHGVYVAPDGGGGALMFQRDSIR